MPLVNPTLPNDGESADAADVSQPILDLLAVFNGHIGADNLEPGTITTSISDGSIVTAKLAAGAVTNAKLASAAVAPQNVVPANTIADTGTITPVATSRAYAVTALAQNATIAAPTGTPGELQALTLRIKDNGTGRTLTWNAIYRAIGVTIPTSTTASKTLYVSLVYNNADTKWDVVGVARES